MLLLFSVHQMALGLFRMLASVARDMVVANTFGSAACLVVMLLGGFLIPKGMCSFCVHQSSIWFSVLVAHFLLFQKVLNHGGSGLFGSLHYRMDNVQFLSMSLMQQDGRRCTAHSITCLHVCMN